MGINYLSTTYLENLVSPSYKKREFSRTVSEALPEGTTKICCKCKIEKHKSEFSKHRKTKDGLEYYCKLCYGIIQNERRRKKWKYPDKPYIGENHSRWKGMNVKYVSKHLWIHKHYGKANHCENPNCKHKSKIFEWANISGKYLREVSDYKQLCRSCHRILDSKKNLRKFCKYGHEFTSSNIIIRSDGYRKCRICKKINNEKYRLKTKQLTNERR